MPCQRPSLIFRMDLNSIQMLTAKQQDFKSTTVVKDEAYKSVITLLCLADFTIFYGAAKLQTTVLAYRSLILCNFTLSMSHNLEDFSSLSHWKSTNKSHLNNLLCQLSNLLQNCSQFHFRSITAMLSYRKEKKKS